MPLNIQQITTFQFSMPVGDTTFNFNIAATSRNEACLKLITALEKITEELNLIIKPGPN